MPDIADGESVEMQGSGAKPYVLKNVGGVYSCSCPAWRNQSLGIEQRTCKHLRKYRGAAAEDARIGSTLSAKSDKTTGASGDQEGGGKQEPPLLLAESWDNSSDLFGWWMSEKLDGVRAYWDGRQFLSRQGNLYHAPDWFIKGLPQVPLDGELWIDRKAFQRTVSIVRRQDRSDHWKIVRYLVFDAPASGDKFEDRMEFLKDGTHSWQNEFVTIHEHSLCRNIAHLREELARIESLGGEGLMLRQPESKYAAGRSATLLKVKTFHDAEAVVMGHESGKGRHRGRLGALSVQLPDGTLFSVGTGLSDREREQPPAVGSVITFRYQELTDAGVPRFPSYVGIRTDAASTGTTPATKKKQETKQSLVVPSKPSEKSSEPQLLASRYFECVKGKSSKFWEIGTVGDKLTTRWGRIGSKGQSKTKKFSSADEAWSERNAAIESKLAHGYKEIEAAAPEEPSGIEPILAEAEIDDCGEDIAPLAERPVAAESIVQESETIVEEVSEQPPNAAPAQIHLDPSPDELLANTQVGDRLTKGLLDAGFTRIGDFSIRELPVVIRAFFWEPSTYAVISELAHLLWVEFSVQNADGTNENWSNVPMHDGITPPWSTIVVKPNADLSELLALMVADHSGKEPARMSSESFVALFEDAYARSMAWRASPPTKPTPPNSSLSPRVEELVWGFAREYKDSGHFFKDSPPDSVPPGKAIMRLGPAEQIEIVKACFLLREPIIDETRYDTVGDLRERLLKKKLPYTESDVEFLAHEIAKEAAAEGGIDKFALSAIEQWAKNQKPTEVACDHLRRARDGIEASYMFRDAETYRARIDTLVGDDDVRNPIQRKEVWAATVIDDVQGMPLKQRTAWIRLLRHCLSATTGKPSSAWIKEAETLIATVSRPELLKCANTWFPLVNKPWTEPRFPAHYANDPLSIVEGNQDILRGLVWCCCLEPDALTARTIGALGISAYRKIRFVGARAVRVGNACVFGLGMMGDADAVAQLAILKVKVKFGTAQRYIGAELDKAAERLGMRREELEEMSVPAYGLDDVGQRREELGDVTAELLITARGSIELRWLKANGTAQKSIPTAVKKDFADEIKDLKAACKDIEKMLPVQRERIDGLFLQSKSWPLAAWRERYLDHPLVGIIARRLIWQFRTGENASAGIWHEGQIVGSNDRPLVGLDESTTVTLWHPIDRKIDEITTWRSWLERHEVQQPFKQAHREVYLLTEAEERTRVYSNRFAAHILRQSQFRALAAARGWQAPLLGYWDGGDSTRATRHLPQVNIIAEFWILGLPPEAMDNNAQDSAGMTYVATDQVRFCRADDPDEPMPLAEVPPRVFSEIMRDADLFVGVASVGNDPNWIDRGPDHAFHDYCQRYSFGELSATARTRFQVLEKLVPRLKIADRCSLSDRFLVVRGDLRTYKIHLGSGNILMSPNDQYLCIVPKPTKAGSDQVFLPFEGDRTLSIVLSKAFLLAHDTKINDPTIMRQINAS